jgi:sarcosine oxidase subunit alpha
VLTDATCNAWFTDNYLPVIQGKRMYKVRATQCLVASGSFDQPVMFPQQRFAGVMLTSAAQRLMKLYAVKPGKRAVVLTGNDDGYLAALDLHEQGVEVAALVDMRNPADRALLRRWKSADPCHLNSTVYEALHEKGMRHVSGVDMRKITGQGQVAESGCAWIATCCACPAATCRSISCCARPAASWPMTISAPSSPSAACRKPQRCRLGQWSPRLDNVLADATRRRRNPR